MQLQRITHVKSPGRNKQKWGRQWREGGGVGERHFQCCSMTGDEKTSMMHLVMVLLLLLGMMMSLSIMATMIRLLGLDHHLYLQRPQGLLDCRQPQKHSHLKCQRLDQ